MTRITAALQGDLRRIVKAEQRAARRAARRGLRKAGRRARAAIKGDVTAANLGRLARSIKLRNFSGRSPLDGAAFVYAKGPAANAALEAFEEGAIIKARNARVLLIPTNFNRAGGRRGGKVLTPADQLDGGFFQRSKSGKLFLFGKPQRATAISGKARGQERAYIGNRLLASGRRKRTREILARRAVPLFRAVEDVKIGKRVNLRQVIAVQQGLLADDVVDEWRRESGE